MKVRYLIKFIIAVLIAVDTLAQTPIASINSLPTAVNGTITICQGQQINFASSSTGLTAKR